MVSKTHVSALRLGGAPGLSRASHNVCVLTSGNCEIRVTTRPLYSGSTFNVVVFYYVGCVCVLYMPHCPSGCYYGRIGISRPANRIKCELLFLITNLNVIIALNCMLSVGHYWEHRHHIIAFFCVVIIR